MKGRRNVDFHPGMLSLASQTEAYATKAFCTSCGYVKEKTEFDPSYQALWAGSDNPHRTGTCNTCNKRTPIRDFFADLGKTLGLI
ncbi:hypothetical protein ACLPJK_26495 [Pseudomonas aeruginosa]|uniref:hypothetical protein n=1 Tax=Pseudomonas aeruginosa TaxID=287 RepID=UPI003D27F896